MMACLSLGLTLCRATEVKYGSSNGGAWSGMRVERVMNLGETIPVETGFGARTSEDPARKALLAPAAGKKQEMELSCPQEIENCGDSFSPNPLDDDGGKDKVSKVWFKIIREAEFTELISKVFLYRIPVCSGYAVGVFHPPIPLS